MTQTIIDGDTEMRASQAGESDLMLRNMGDALMVSLEFTLSVAEGRK